MLPALLITAGCGQSGPLRHPWETEAEARAQAQNRHIPQGTRSDLPTAADDASISQPGR